jgi:hypothetical protein
MNWMKKHDFKNFKNMLNYERRYMVLVLRDPCNWIASCIKRGTWSLDAIQRKIKLYIGQCEYYLNSISYTHCQVITILFNDWFSNYLYRCSAAYHLQIKRDNVNNGINYLSTRGGGSSFDKGKFKNRAQEMNVLHRWKYYEKLPAFWDLVNMVPEECQNIFPKVKAEVCSQIASLKSN